MRALATLGTLLLSGCGAMMSPGPFQLAVESEPPGALVLHEGKEVGTTPCVVTVSRTSREVELQRPGFHAQRVDVGTERNPWIAANALSLGLGLFVDEALGTSTSPITQPLVVHLAPADGPARSPWRREAAPGKTCSPPPTPTGLLIAGALELVAQANGGVVDIDSRSTRWFQQNDESTWRR